MRQRIAASGFFNKIIAAFRAMNTDFPFSFRDADFLFALRAAQDPVVGISFLSGRASAENAGHFASHLKILLVFRPARGDVAGHHPVIKQDQQDQADPVQNVDVCDHFRDDAAERHDADRPVQVIVAVTAVHKALQFISHNMNSFQKEVAVAR